ncbi:MAG: sensor histidine kinase [Lachnospiraceae bacterium]|nr:sensor histidine kinase [Lachnospiraceae bacterium]
MIDYLNGMRLRAKLKLLFAFGVMLPMVIMDVVILAKVYNDVALDVENELERTATSVEYALQKHIEYPANIAHNIYKSRVIEEFLNEQYTSSYDYYDAYYRLESGMLFDATMGINGATVSIFADNPTILNGSGFYQMKKYENEDWYRELYAGKPSRKLVFEYGTGMSGDTKERRRVLILVKMNMGAFRGCKKTLRMDLDFSDFEDELEKLDIDDRVYVCDNSHLIFTNRDSLGETEPYEDIPQLERISYKKNITLYGKPLAISIVSDKNKTVAFFMRNGAVFALMMLINITTLALMMFVLERTMIKRIAYLEDSFGIMRDGKMQPIEEIGGDDEITALAHSYNSMAERINDLVNTVYLDRLREQEMDLSRQKAELLALHSQINPHFLFNVLESVRMHSLLKGEKETAQMVGKLAVMERTYVNWGDDEIPIHKEMDFVEAYLALQKYRFGDRLSYELTVDEDCRMYALPKLSIVTFVENACEHGVEKKAAPGWIFVRISKNEKNLTIEVEDTGFGMDEKTVEEIRERAEGISIAKMQGKSHIGIMNAILRLKLMTDGRAGFEIESEPGVGTTVKLTIPTGEA